MHHVVPFLVVAALVIVVPGQDTALTIRNTLGSGRRAGVATALGVSCGQTVWALATSLGLAALLVASEPAYLALRTLGAAYLIWLGASCLWRAIRGYERVGEPTARAPRETSGAAFRQGIVSNLGNPKMAVFFTSLLPQFTTSQATFAATLALGLVFCLLTLGWLALYAYVVARAARVLLRPFVRRAIDTLTGLALVAFGARLLADGGSTR